ncbi:MAG: 5-oxoprolinase subunit PxpB [Pseudomonadota bacterium]
MSAPRFLACGDAALSVEFGDRIDPAHSAQVLALEGALARDPFAGLIETMPSFRALLVRYEPLTLSFAEAVACVKARLTAAREQGESAATPARLWRFPVAYGGEEGPDLAEVAARSGLTEAAVVAAHSGVAHRVYMLGFLPGAPFLGGLPAQIDLPRRAEPRVAVPARSVAIAVGLSVIYPVESPGGWNLLGRTPARLFAAEAEPPALLAPGDAVRFEPAAAEDVARLAERAAAGDWRPACEPEGGGA